MIIDVSWTQLMLTTLTLPVIPAKLVYSYSDLSDIVQLDGAADNDSEEEETGSLEENDFLGMINAEAIKALQEGEVSSDDTSGSTSGDSADELASVEDEVSGSLMLQESTCLPTMHSVLL